VDAGDRGLGRTGVLGLVLVEALGLAARLAILAVVLTVLLDTVTPVAKLQAFKGSREASILPARGD
jgi:hypothetical protein